jgi:hypothetical protein
VKLSEYRAMFPEDLSQTRHFQIPFGDWARVLSKNDMELLLKKILADLNRAPLDK